MSEEGGRLEFEQMVRFGAGCPIGGNRRTPRRTATVATSAVGISGGGGA